LKKKNILASKKVSQAVWPAKANICLYIYILAEWPGVACGKQIEKNLKIKYFEFFSL